MGHPAHCRFTQRHPAEDAMSIKHLDHLNLTVSDLEETIAWHGAVFGFDILSESTDAPLKRAP
jgi:hypothetical protein